MFVISDQCSLVMSQRAQTISFPFIVSVKNAVEILLEYMCSGKVNLTIENVQNVFFAANFLEMLEVMDMCIDPISQAVESPTAWPRITTVKN